MFRDANEPDDGIDIRLGPRSSGRRDSTNSQNNGFQAANLRDNSKDESDGRKDVAAEPRANSAERKLNCNGRKHNQTTCNGKTAAASRRRLPPEVGEFHSFNNFGFYTWEWIASS
ncbi:hypothetical protein QAD02_010775 [Eretmocerus hayati]|uniref:Uncharacterized protein n=1 Tax=Eretmocerus hayati TaxID=131215 RepID=A0ACC2NXG8_9HYME|nr:hypothetical protein QAD02_010775 [Eretmocerus hayati]